MDVITHVLLAVGLGLATRRWAPDAVRQAWVPVAGAAALAPDLDVLLTPLARIDALYWLSHRSASHSIVAAPMAAAAFVWLLGRWGRRWWRLRIFGWDKRWLPALFIGAWSHLPLDIVTIKGVPLWWPVTDVFVSLRLFFWIVPWLAPISFFALLWRYRGKWDDRRLAQAGVVVLAVIVVLAGIRIGLRPEGDEVYPTPAPWAWTVATEHPNGTWQLEVVGGRDDGMNAWYEAPRPPGSEAAVAHVQDSLAYRAFRFDSVGPIVIQAEAAPGGWWVNATDALQDFELRDLPDWLPRERFEEESRLDVFVADGQ